MRNNNNWDVCPKWIKFPNEETHPDIKMNSHNFCPDWVRISTHDLIPEKMTIIKADEP